MNFRFFEPWHDFLPRDGGHVVAFMGGGGKTTLLEFCTDVYASLEIPCVTTATVPGDPPGRGPVVDQRELQVEGPPQAVGDSALLRIGSADGALTPEDVDLLGGMLPDHVVLVEIDTSDGLPLRMPDAAVPRWPDRTSLAVVVMGLGAVGSPAGEVVAGFKGGILAGNELATWSTWEWEHCLELLSGPGGYLDQIPPGVPAVLALTGLDLQPDSVGLFDFVGRAMADPRVPIVVFGSLAGDEPSLRAVSRDDDEPGEPDAILDVDNR